MNIMFYKDGQSRPYATPNDVANDDGETIEFRGSDLSNVDYDEGIVTLYTTGHHFYLTLDHKDINSIEEAMTKTSTTRQLMHDVLDKMLDHLDAQGYDNEEVFISVKAYDVEEVHDDDPNVMVTVEDFYSITAEIAAGAVEDVTTEHSIYKNQNLTTGPIIKSIDLRK